VRKITIGFSKPKGFFKPYSWLIRAFLRTPYSHVYCKHRSEKYNLDLIYQASGIQVNFMSGKQFNKDAITVAEFSFDISEEQFDEYMAFAIGESGAHYSKIKPFEIVFKKDFDKETGPQWVCSTLVAKVCKDYLSDKTVDLDYANPKDIYNFCMQNGTRVIC
jgi:hypothetical protein